MTMIFIDWIWVALVVATTAGSIAYGWIAARKEQRSEILRLQAEVERQRAKKKFWKAKAKDDKGLHPDAGRRQLSSHRTLAMHASGSGAS
jgi:hypothetical protein